MKAIFQGIALAALLTSATLGQTLPDDLELVASNSIPGYAFSWYSIANWPVWPPLPARIIDGDVYVSISLGTNVFFIDDRESTLLRMSEDSGLLPPGYDPNS